MNNKVFQTVETVIRQMNRCTQCGEPFLFAFNFEMTEALFVPRPLEQQEVLFRTTIGGNAVRNLNASPDLTLHFHAESLDRYRQRFSVIQRHLRKGNSFLTNLSVRTPVETEASLRDIFDAVSAPYCLYIPQRMVCFSPERFVFISEQGVISTDPMKGTIDADIPDARERILGDVKETAEHATVVDLLRNDLSIHAMNVGVRRYRYITTIHTNRGNLLQVSSEIEGRLEADWQARVGHILTDMLPAGSVSGAPKKATVAAIREAEQQDRGFYTGIFGYFDGRRLDSGVIIRYIEEDDGRKFFRSGGGITAKSDLESEYQEVIQKIYIPEMKPTFSDVIRVEDGQLQHLDYHQQRVNRTAGHFYGTSIDLGSLQDAIPEDMRTGTVKCRIVYADKLQEVTFAPYQAKRILTCTIVHDDVIAYDYKSVDRSRLAALHAEAGTDDIIIVKNGMVTDSSFCNLVFEDADGQLFTPTNPLLRGCMRQWLLDEGRIREIPISEDMLRNYVSVRFINAMRGLELDAVPCGVFTI